MPPACRPCAKLALQLDLLKLLMGPRRSIVVVGCPDQTIYSFLDAAPQAGLSAGLLRQQQQPAALPWPRYPACSAQSHDLP